MRAAIASLVLFFGTVEGSEWGAKFELFMKKHNRDYTGEEKVKRFGNFVDNAMHAEGLNSQTGSSVKYGITSMSDLSQEEFERLNALRVTPEVIAEHKARRSAQGGDKKTANPLSLPTSFDWREKGAVNEIKNQAQCGSCWAFGTVASIEGNNFVKNNNLVSLSEQELVSCDNTDHGCYGGLPQWAYKWMIENGQGLETESDYSYTSGNGDGGICKVDQSKERVFLQGWHSISEDEDEIAAKLMEYGPLAVAINASGLVQNYQGGIITGYCGGRINHAVTLVGFGEEDGQKYWIVRNSWGPTWGESGYFRMARGVNQCLITTLVTAADVKSSDVSMFV